VKSFFDNYVGRFVIGMILLIGWCVSAQAQTCTQVATNRVRICVSGPTQFVGDTNIPAGTSITYKYFQQAGTTWNQIGSNASTTFASELTTGVLAPGTYVFRVTATVASSESDPSATASKTTTDPQPKPPTVVVAQLEVLPGRPLGLGEGVDLAQRCHAGHRRRREEVASVHFVLSGVVGAERRGGRRRSRTRYTGPEWRSSARRGAPRGRAAPLP
jgi:hypothetical protein